MKRWLAALAATLLLAGCSEESRPGPDNQGPDVGRLEVTGSEAVELPASARLSPTGARVLSTLGDPCVRRLNGAEEVCVDRDRVSPDMANATWSPDGTMVAFTDDFWRMAHEPDVWVLNATNGVLRNLTDDGEDEFRIGETNDGADFDLLPSWSADGESVLFARGGMRSESMELMSVPAGGGEASKLREVECATTSLSALAWSESQVAWTCGQRSAATFVAGHTGGEPERLLPEEEGEDRMLLSFSPDGRWLLVDSLAPYGSPTEAAGGSAVVVPAEGGDPVPVKGKAAFPTWSPGGHAIAYVELPNRLMVVSEPGGEPRELRRSESVLGSPDGRRLGWTHDRLLVYADQEAELLTLSG